MGRRRCAGGRGARDGAAASAGAGGRGDAVRSYPRRSSGAAARAVQRPGPGAPHAGRWGARGHRDRPAGHACAHRSPAGHLHQSGAGRRREPWRRVRGVQAGVRHARYVLGAGAGDRRDRAHAGPFVLGTDPQYRARQPRSGHAGAAHPEDAFLIRRSPLRRGRCSRLVVLTTHFVALGLYALATVLVLAPFAGLRPAPRGLLLGVPIAGIAAHALGVMRLTPFMGVAPTLSMLALFLALFQVASEAAFRASAVGVFTGPLATGLIGLALLIGLVPEARPVAGRSPWSILHITISILGLAMLALAFIAAALYLLQFRELKAKRFGQVFRLFPPLERLDQLNHLSLVVGFPTVTLGVLLGFGVRYAGGVSVNAAQVVWGMLMWLVLGWAVGVRVVRHWAGRRAAFASIASFAAVLLVYLALKLTTPGTQRFL
ncbi:MAG: hypothetical protein DMD73_01670 [Gemmatimonadetes bacterium]|nr:MAG: hypothetical protein DMD73_01670 [Gemmatimonadota bacterium]